MSNYYQRLFIFLTCILLSTLSYSQLKYSSKVPQNWEANVMKNAANNSRSDSIDVLNYTIRLDISNFTSKVISGNCTVRFSAKLNGINSIDLDLLKLTVDSVIQHGNMLSKSYNDTLLKIFLSNSLNVGDTDSITVYYHGIPKIDNSGWGGFYFTPTYAYNLGVGFDANPHNYGRVWFPCFDNFVERSTYLFSITSSAGKKAACNGLLLNHVVNPNATETWDWQINQPIPSYLASVAISAYKTVRQTFTGINGPVPVELHGVATDTNNIKASFIHLENAFDRFEACFGAYSWDKIGYSFVPFSSGAMEHATNITYPRSFADGTLGLETIMAHEFAHHWWGDLVTCRTAEDMWINEGMASYCEDLFIEDVYGWNSYVSSVRSNLSSILQFAHYKEGGYQAISGVPHSLTYGDHVYLKGKAVAHSLRAYMGDSLFFSGMTQFLNSNKFKDVSSADLRDGLETASGLDLHPFFDDWVFAAGYPHFSIDSMKSNANGPLVDVELALKQKITGAPHYYHNIPIEVTFFDSAWAQHHQTLILEQVDSVYQLQLPYQPIYAAINYRQKLADAISSEAKIIRNTGVHNFTNARMNVNVTSLTDSLLLRIEHNWTAPDALKDSSKHFRLSPNRYWKVSGIVPGTFNSITTIQYNGQTGNQSGNFYLDNLLITGKEDSLVLLYRSGASDDWELFPSYTKNMGNVNDKIGTMQITNLIPGEYCLALKNGPLSNQSSVEKAKKEFKIYPNPAGDKLTIELMPAKNTLSDVDINDSSLKLFESYRIDDNQTHLTVNTEDWPNGIYFVIITQHGTQQTIMQKVIINHRIDTRD